jgi:hypothetical protein
MVHVTNLTLPGSDNPRRRQGLLKATHDTSMCEDDFDFNDNEEDAVEGKEEVDGDEDDSEDDEEEEDDEFAAARRQLAEQGAAAAAAGLYKLNSVDP